LFYVPLKQTAGRFNTDYSTKAMQKICSNFSGAANFWVDTCLCSSLDTGHCCVHHPSGKIDLESSLTLLSKMALELAQAGADGVAPSDMMDGRVAQMREGLDRAGLTDTPIMSYSTKFASGMYGPFRGAADSSPQTGDRKTYQLDVRDSVSALEASRRCATEGADFLMVKPGMTSLDLIPQIKAETGKHVGAYQVSGEYASLLALEEKGFGDFSTLLLETWCVFRRAGSSFIITYGARDAKTILEKL
jgi:porphobilinogen synthase